MSNTAESDQPIQLKTGGPTLEEYVAAGYSAENYPPQGYAATTVSSKPTTMRTFKKINVALPFNVNGKSVPFQQLSGNIGVIALDPAKDEVIIAALDAAADARRGGVVRIDAAELENLKKNRVLSPSGPLSRQPSIKIWDSNPLRAQRQNVAPAVSSPHVSAPAGNGVAAVAGNGAGAGNTPAPFTPNLARKSAGPVLRPPSTGQFRDDIPVFPPLVSPPPKT